MGNALTTQRGELSAIETEVIKNLVEQKQLSQNVVSEFETKLSFGDKLADRVAEFGGGWRFIITFGSVLVIWIGINSLVLL